MTKAALHVNQGPSHLSSGARFTRWELTTAGHKRSERSELSYSTTREGWLHFGVVIDQFARLVVDWMDGDSLQRDLFMQREAAGLIHHL